MPSVLPLKSAPHPFPWDFSTCLELLFLLLSLCWYSSVGFRHTSLSLRSLSPGQFLTHSFPFPTIVFFLSLYMALISCMYVIFISCNFLTLSSLFITVFCPWLFLPHPFHIFLLTTDLMSFPSPRSSSRPICSHSSPGYLHPNYTIETLAVFLK